MLSNNISLETWNGLFSILDGHKGLKGCKSSSTGGTCPLHPYSNLRVKENSSPQVSSFNYVLFAIGILDLGSAGQNVKRARTVTFLRKHATGTAPTELHTVHVERGMSWDEVLEKWAELTEAKEGFYLSHQIRNNKHTAILAVEVDNTNKKKSESKSKKDQMYFVYRPNTGLQFRQESLAELEKKYKKVG